jgi:hypothetical protein
MSKCGRGIGKAQLKRSRSIVWGTQNVNPGYKLLKANVKVDRIVNAIPVVNQNHMSPDDDVTVAARGTAQTARQITGCRATHPPHIIIEHVAWPKPTFVVVVPSAVLSKMPLVLVVISTRVLALILVELAILLLTLAAILVFCHSRTACQSQQRRRTSSHPPSCLHKFPPSHTGIAILKSRVAVGVRLSELELDMTFISEGEARVSSILDTHLVKLAHASFARWKYMVKVKEVPVKD